ncbi:aromatic amino acid lyase, partial [Actinosynnema sp. NPDC023658]|uniref:aromatic amino acid lyase n=1 Tax=Actinosynnema sp. NPDC023658 TaxID=3155465 RepID=UPI0033C5D5AB
MTTTTPGSRTDAPVDLGEPLSSDDLHRAAARLAVVVGPPVRERLDRSREFLSTVLKDDERPVYGAKTGFGALVGFAGREDEADQCDNTLAHLGAGQGPDLPAD